MKVDPRSIHVDQRKQDTRRDAWDRDYTDKRMENAKPVFVFAFFYVMILIMISSAT